MYLAGYNYLARPAAGNTWTVCTPILFAIRIPGSKPCKLAASGEIPIGISFAFRAAKSKNKGAPLDTIIPSEGIGWDLEAQWHYQGHQKAGRC